jgi:glutamine amidotransferase
MIFAHVRATTEGSLAENNCHPFQHNTLMWMHNGNIGGWNYVKRPLSDSLSDKWFLGVKGGTDSEWAFALFLDTLEKEGVDPSSVPDGGFGEKILRKAMTKTIAKINAFVKEIPAEYKLADVETRSLLNFAVADGHSVIVTRYVSSKTDAAASLYYSSGTDWVEGKVKGQFKMERRDKASDVVLVASEPLTFERHNWLSVPTNTLVTISSQTVFVRPIKDEFYDDDPSTERSTGFAKSKGLVAKAPGDGAPSIPPTPAEILTLKTPDLTSCQRKLLYCQMVHDSSGASGENVERNIK